MRTALDVLLLIACGAFPARDRGRAQDVAERQWPAGRWCEHAPKTVPESLIHHPAFQSLALPLLLLLALLGIAMVRSGLDVGHATWGGRLRPLGALCGGN